MGGKLLDGLLFSCWHEFSWPRRLGDGGYYQVCLRCGAEYSYDWSSMRRIKRIKLEEAAPEPEAKHTRKPCHRSSWSPRERRLKWQVPVLYRQQGQSEWLTGETENISRSGVLFRAAAAVPRGAKLDVVFEMPVEIAGHAGANVLCLAQVARVAPGKDECTMIAAAIADYEFMKDQKAV